MAPVLPLLALAARAALAAALAVTGFILDGAPDSLVHKNAGALANLGVDGVQITADGRHVHAPSAGAQRLLSTAHADGLTAELLVSNFSSRTYDFDPEAGAHLLRSPANVRRVAGELASYVVDEGWDGVAVDLESLRRGDADGLLMLIEELQARMPAEKTVSIDMMASAYLPEYRARGYRLAEIGRAVDVLAIMTYDFHGPGWSGPGPIGPLGWQRDVLDLLATKVPLSKVDLGVAGYGYTWPADRDKVGHTVSVKRARELVAADGARAVWKATAGEWKAKLSDGTVLWWSDGRSYDLREQLATQRGLHGLALWRLGSTDTLD
jgi:spore germination protein YaaH